MTSCPVTEEAERIVDAWEAEEGESMREGHRATLERLIAAALSSAQERIEGAEEEIERLKHATRTRPDYDLRCQDCGGSHYIDTSIPSPTWNAICENRPGVLPGAAGIGMPEVGVLCPMCIEDRLEKAGLEAVAEFYYGGGRLRGKGYTESQGEVEYLQREIITLRERIAELEKREGEAREEGEKAGIKAARAGACVVCWTNSWVPVPPDDPDAQEFVDLCGTARCDHCWLQGQADALRAQATTLREALQGLLDHSRPCDCSSCRGEFMDHRAVARRALSHPPTGEQEGASQDKERGAKDTA